MDESRFVSELVARRDAIHAMLIALSGNPAAADDLFQEMALVMTRRRGEMDDPSKFMAWARAIGRNVVLDHWKRTRRHRAAPLDEAAFEQVAGVFADADASVWEERRAALAECVRALPPENRDLLDRHYRQGFSIKSLAAALRRSSGSVYVRLHRLRAGLLRCAEERLGISGLT